MDDELKGGMLCYRCRMCGEQFQHVHVPDVAQAISAIIYDFPNPWRGDVTLPKLIETHYHKDGYGVADLIGGMINPLYISED